MNYKKKLLLLLCILILLMINCLNIFAMTTGFSTDKMEHKEQQEFLSNISMTMFISEIKTQGIECFDVNENGLIALGFEDSNQKSIGVYTLDGTFKYGYSFSCYGSFGVEWNEDNLLIYFVRSGVAASFDDKGVCVELTSIQDTIENNSYWNHTVFSTERKIEDKLYEIKNNMGPLNLITTSYSQLISIDESGAKTVICNFNNYQTAKTVFNLAVILMFIIIIVCILIFNFKKHNYFNMNNSH